MSELPPEHSGPSGPAGPQGPADRLGAEYAAAALGALSEGVVMLLAGGEIVSCNAAAERILGLTRDQMAGRTSLDPSWRTIHEDGSPFLGETHPAMVTLRTGEPVRDVVMGVHRPDGTLRWISINTAPTPESDGRPASVVVAFVDVTDRKRTEAYREVSRDVLQILNEPGELTGSVERVLAALKARTGVDAVGIRLQAGDDYPYFAQDGFSEEFVLAENSLAERRPGGAVCRDEEGKIRLECTCGLVISGKTDPANPLFTPGGSCWTNDSFPFLDFPASEDPRLKPRNNCIHEGYASVALVPIRNKEKIVGLLQLNDRRKGRFTPDGISLLESAAAHLGEALMRRRAEESLQAEVTWRRKASESIRILNEQLRGQVQEALEANRELEAFSYSVSHDLRAPLRAVNGFATLLGQHLGGALDDKGKRLLRSIADNGHLMGNLVDGLLEFTRTRVREVVRIPLDMKKLTEQVVVELLAGPGPGQVEVRVADLPPASADCDLVASALMHLLSNAIRFSLGKPNPLVEVGFRAGPDGPVYFVKDNGIGFDTRYANTLFRVFYRLEGPPEPDRPGLGLALVRRIVERHGGRVWAEGVVNEGATFYFTLAPPAAAPEPAGAPA